MQRSTQQYASVYIVDGRLRARSAIRELFAASHLSVRLYANAEAFLADLSGTPCGCLICQLDLPGMNGLELLEQLKAHGLELPTIVLAHRTDMATAVRSMRAGAVDFIESATVDARVVQRAQEVLERQARGNHHRGRSFCFSG